MILGLRKVNGVAGFFLECGYKNNRWFTIRGGGCAWDNVVTCGGEVYISDKAIPGWVRGYVDNPLYKDRGSYITLWSEKPRLYMGGKINKFAFNNGLKLNKHRHIWGATPEIAKEAEKANDLRAKKQVKPKVLQPK